MTRSNHECTGFFEFLKAMLKKFFTISPVKLASLQSVLSN